MKKSPSFRMYVLLSLLVHVLIVGALLLLKTLEKSPPPPQAVTIDFITPEDIAQQSGTRPQQKPLPNLPANQIVEQQNQIESEEPVDSRFLSEKNQKVQKQTVAAARGEFQNQRKNAKTQAGSKGDGKPKGEALAKELFKGFDPSEAVQRQKVAEQEAGKGLGKGTADRENPDKEGGDVSQTNDYIKDVDTGLETLLNTREFKYYSYYSRIRKQLSQHWEGRVREKLSKLFKEGRAPASTGRDRITKLMIVLNNKGTLVRVQVLSDSGVQDLDDAAIEAFRAAAPFPNPPLGIVEQDGTVKIRWDFILEV